MLGKKILLILLIITILAGGYYFFHKKTISRWSFQSQKTKEWKNISKDFESEPQLKKEWENRNFTYEQTHDWMKAGLKPLDASFAEWLRDQGNFTPETMLNYGNETDLRKDYEIYRKQQITLKDQILAGLWEWMLTDFSASSDSPTKNTLQKTIRDLKNNFLDESLQLVCLKNLLSNHFQYSKENNSSDGPFLRELSQNYQNLQKLTQEWEQSLVESSRNNGEWFKQGKNLTMAEIDWATSQINHNLPIKILSASWFTLMTEKINENATISQILNQIRTEDELIFIPVNNLENNHWSLLVFEQQNNLFYHYDTKKDEWGVGNDCNHLEAVLEKIINQMNGIKRQTGNISENFWELYFRNRNWFELFEKTDSGIMVISLIKKIIDLYSSRFRLKKEVVEREGEKYSKEKQYLKEVEKNLGEFDFSAEREKWQKKYLSEIEN